MNFSIKDSINIVTGKLTGWLETLTAMLPNLLVAILILVVFYFFARLAKKVAGKIFQQITDKPAIQYLFQTVVYLVTLGVGLVVALNVLNLQQTVTSILAGAGIVGLALGFAFQDIAANFISGIMMAFRKPIIVGDIVESGDYMGFVEKIDLRVTTIRTFQGLHVLIPNKDVSNSPITNYTKTNERRVDLELGVSYADDLEKVKEVTLKTLEELPFLLKNKSVDFFYTGFGGSSIDFSARFWVEYPDQPGFLKAQSDAIMAVKKAFDTNEITIPFPIRTLDFGIEGGEKLSEMSLQITSKSQSSSTNDAVSKSE